MKPLSISRLCMLKFKMKRVIPIRGTIKIRSDPGKEFENSMFKSIWDNLGI